MKRWVYILAVILFLGNSTELRELARLPALLQHFFYHRSEDPSLSLLDFLKLHYSKDHPNDNDDSKDQELPFKSPGNLIHTDIPLFTIAELCENPLIYFNRKVRTCHPEGMPLHKSFSIFHPPRLA